MAEWTKGWVFVYEGTYYWVGAPDVETAKRFVAQHNPAASMTEPERLTNGAGYINLSHGTVLIGRKAGPD